MCYFGVAAIASGPARGEAIMAHRRRLPERFLRELEALESSYLEEDDPIRQSGFGGGSERWRAEREPILDAIDADGDILDIGCANGYLLECLMAWGHERDLSLTPYGLDHGRRLIELAKHRLPDFESNFYRGNAWDWEPPRRFDYVYTLYDCVPVDYLGEYLGRLHERFLARRGRLIVGAYGSNSRRIPAFEVAEALSSAGLTVAGSTSAGPLPNARFAWVDA